jgi:hypothetical protein
MRNKVVLALAFGLALSAAASVGGAPKATTAPVEMMQPGQSGPVRSVLLDAVTTGAGQFDASAYSSLTFYLQSNGTTSGGVITLEEADWDAHGGTPYTGTWSSITTINASSFTGSVQLAYHLSPAAFGNVRARVSSTITGGGTVTVTLRAK